MNSFASFRCFVAGGLITLNAALTLSAHHEAPTQPKNILLIMADDIGIEAFGCYGGESYATPRIDQLAAEGIRFSHAYSQPLCTPTRVQIMTGKYNHRNWEAFGILPQGERTFGHIMSGFGYDTLISGKWQLTSYDPPDFPNADRRRNTGMHPRDAGFDEYLLFHSEHTEDKGSRYANPTYMLNDKLITEQGTYGEDTNTDYILDFMARNRDENMFVYYPMALPHWPANPTPHSEAWADPSRRLENDQAFFPDMVEYMDTLIGKLMDGLEELGLRDDTLIIFYSDNGTDKKNSSVMNGVKIDGQKSYPVQAGVRVPLVASWPKGMPQGIVSRDLVDSSDFLPTLVELAGHQAPAEWGFDGQSFAAQLRGHAHPSPRESVFVWYDPRPGDDKAHLDRAVFALDHNYKLYDDGRLMEIDDILPLETELVTTKLSREAQAAHAKLSAVIAAQMQPPLSPRVANEVDAYGEPLPPPAAEVPSSK
jgi:arylsulfatase A-like enzyme